MVSILSIIFLTINMLKNTIFIKFGTKQPASIKCTLTLVVFNINFN